MFSVRSITLMSVAVVRLCQNFIEQVLAPHGVIINPMVRRYRSFELLWTFPTVGHRLGQLSLTEKRLGRLYWRRKRSCALLRRSLLLLRGWASLRAPWVYRFVNISVIVAVLSSTAEADGMVKTHTKTAKLLRNVLHADERGRQLTSRYRVR